MINNVNLGDGCSQIGNEAFFGCSNLYLTTIPETVTSINDGAFSSCTSLDNIIYYATCKIPESAFQGCSSLYNFNINSGTTIDVDSYAFQDTYLSTITFDMINPIGNSIFYNTQFTSVEIPNTWTTINDNLFENSRITSLTFESPSTLTSIKSSSFKGCPLSSMSTLTIPDSVQTIGSNAFYGSQFQGELIIGSGVTSIDYYAFEDLSITILSFATGSKLQNIYAGAFQGCSLSGMSTLTIPDSVQTIGYNAFYGSQFQGELIIGSGVTSIGNNAFKEVLINKLSFATGSKLQTIDNGAFKGCPLSGANLEFPDTVQYINDEAFAGTKIPEVSKWPANLAEIGDYAFDGSTISGSITLPVNLKSIGSCAFRKTKLSGSLTLNAKLESIGDYAFKDTQVNADLTNLPPSLSYLGRDAFEGTPTQRAPLSSLKSIPDYYFAGQTIDSVTFKADLLTIGKHAFEKSILKVDKITFPSTLNSIGEYAFYQADFKGEVGFDKDSSLEKIQPYTFYKVPFTTFTFPEKLKYINGNAFQDSGASFSWDALPDTLIEIGQYAFENTKFTSGSFSDKLKSLKSLSTIGKYAFNLKDKSISGSLDLSNINLGENAFGVASFSDIIIIDNAVISEKGFQKATIANSITIKDSTINKDAFSEASFTSNKATFTIIDSTIAEFSVRGFSFNGGGTLTIKNCRKINKNAFERILGKPIVVFEHDEHYDSKCSIEDEAFYNSQIVGPLEIPDFISKVGKNAFAHCQYLDKDLILNASTINDYSFAYCAFNGKLTLGSNIETFTKTNGRFHGFEGCEFNSLTLEPELKISIPAGMFYQLRTIEGEVKFSEHVSGIEDEAFSGCTRITSIVFDRSPQNPLSIGKSAFFGCSNIGGDIEIDRLVYYDEDLAIAEKAFYGCSNIHSIDLPNEITTISSGAFYGCYGLETINMPKSLTKLDQKAFYRCSSLNIDLVIPDGVETVGAYAFYECTSLKSLDVGYGVTRIDGYAFCRCGFKGDLIIPRVTNIQEGAFLGCEGFNGKLELFNGFNGKPSTSSTSTIRVGKSAFEGCTNIIGPLDISHISSISERAFYGCSSLTGELKFYSSLNTINNHIFDGCRSLTGPIVWPSPQPPTYITSIGEYAFNGCSGLSGNLNLPERVSVVKQHAFHGCSGLTGPIVVPTILTKIEKYAFAGCSSLSDSIKINVGSGTTIERNAFDGCTGFKDGTLTIFIENNEERGTLQADIADFYRYKYFLRIENEAFEDCKFKNVYYNGRFEPDCDYDIGISSRKGIHTSSNYVNKSFCHNPIHHDNLSGGAIAGIVIACIVVVAAIVVLIVYLIIKMKKKRDASEEEVEQ